MKCNSETGFKVNFNILDYKDVWQTPPSRMEEVINWDKPAKECVWKRVVPDVITERYKQQEVTRVLKTGVWIFIKEMPVWLPPSYYFFLQYFRLGSEYPEFRLKRLKHVYHKLRVRNNPRAIGTYTIKNRQDGETTISMSDCLWEVAFGNMDYGAIGMQSKTRDTVEKSCWRSVTIGWNGMEDWLKGILYPDFKSGDKIAEKMKFASAASGENKGRDVLLTYGPSTHNAFDSMNNMRRCVLDEVNKWEECSFYSTFLNYQKFIAPGATRKGLFDIFSSPADTAGKHNEEAFEFWKRSDPANLTDLGSTETRIFRYYSNPLEGIEGMYDEYGDADAEEIHAKILRDRKAIPKDKLMAEIRGLPLNEQEMFGSTDTASLWDNTKGISERSAYLAGTLVKNIKDNEPINIYGVHEWKDGVIDTEVVFRMADKNYFDLEDARVCYSYLPQNREPLRMKYDRPAPPAYVENCLGIDPYDKRHTSGNKLSNGAMVNQKFRDLYETGIVKCPTMIYSNRPTHPEIFYEDAIKAAVFNRSMVQVENLNSNIIDYFEDRGYIDWMLSKIGLPQNSLIKGDAPKGGGGKNAFLDEVIGLINAITNTPLLPTDQYLLEINWFQKLLDDILTFDRKDTHKNDLTMAWGQALIGAVKVMHKKMKQKHPEMGGILSYMLG